MSGIIDEHRPYKPRTAAEMREALRRFCHAAWYPPEQRGDEHRPCFSIPPDDEDADIILSDAIRELLELRQRELLLELRHQAANPVDQG